MQRWNNLKDSSRHIDKVMNTLSIKEILQNRLRLKTSLEAVKWLAMQGCSFRGHDEYINSTNRGNFIEMIKLQAKRHSELKSIREAEIQEWTALGELETDYQLTELNNRFPEQTIELLTLSTTLSPIDVFKSFDVDDIFTLSNKFYSEDFSKNEIEDLRRQLSHYRLDVLGCPKFQNLASLSELCQCLAKTKRSENYTLIDKSIRLVLTLPVSTVTTERAFSAMKLVKTPLRKKMDDDFLTDCMVIYIEREIVDIIDLDSIIDEFDDVKPR
ncbi:hypothetical protein Ddye_018552 [Dipteronia dyeriana]|uniref:HAT C-terminal dimerisation domain-containing protein n=1 Tax=Dipteronia dyeriana TaxID=168575 RepID=A0AAD9X1U4_9ROSI|nr:hypothetical protein Ddye_018552 [Dipteronia dyeriana]